MKILILTQKVPFPPRDGGAIATLSMAEGLSDNGNEVTMLCVNTKKHSYNVNNIHPSIKKKIHFYAVDHNTSVNIIKAFSNIIFSREPYNATRFRSRRYAAKLKELLQKEDYGLIQLEGPYMGYYVQLIRQYSNAKISLRSHNVEHEIWQRKAINSGNVFLKFYYSLLSGRIRILEKRVLESCDFLVAISERDRKLLLQLNDLPGLTIPTGINTYRYPTPKDPEFPSLFYIGALDWMPNQEGISWFVEDVFPLVRKNSPKTVFHIAGRNAPDWLHSKLLNERKNGIVFHGEVENAYTFMNRYAIFINPLLTGSGIRIKILEGMVMRRVIIATSIAAEGLPVSDRKNIIIADTAKEMANSIIEIALDKEKYQSIAKSSRSFVIENFNNLAICKRLSEFYRMNLT